MFNEKIGPFTPTTFFVIAQSIWAGKLARLRKCRPLCANKMPKRKSTTTSSMSKEETKGDDILSKISGAFLECTICLEPFKDPKVLPCLHTFCEGCLKKLVEQQDDAKDTFQCPTCRTDTSLPVGGVAFLKNNFFVQSLSDTVQTHKSLVSKEDDKVKCDNCEEEVANHGCVPCEEFLCDECACAHRRGKRTRGHEVIGVAELKEQLINKTGLLKSRSLPICPKHEDEKLKFYCETCKHPICRDCTVLQHKNHTYGYLADTVCDVRAKIQNKLEAARQQITKYQDKARAVAKRQDELHTTWKKAADDINVAAKEEIKYLTSLVKRKQTELEEKLAEIITERFGQLSVTADSVESTLDSLSSTVDFAQKVVEHGSDFDIMNVYSDVTTRLESLLEGPTKDPDIPDDINCLMFEVMTQQKKKDEEEEDKSRAEATFRFTVDNFSQLSKNSKVSPAVFIRNLPWKIETRPEHNDNKKSLAFFMKCNDGSKSLWSCKASVVMRLIPQKDGVQTYERKYEVVFYNKGNSWGYAGFFPWDELCDPQKGYIKDDKIILEAYVKADAPKFMKETIVRNIFNEEVPKNAKNLQTQSTFRFTVENVSKLLGRKFSHTVFICGLPWKIMAMPGCSAPPHHNSLGVYLQCDVDADSSSFWSCCVSVELRLISQKNGVKMYKRKFGHVFHSKNNSCGCPDFMPWPELCDPQKGYIKDDKIILEAYVNADAPCAMV
ncbi:E3 ubiquitin-protein ligase TRIM37-like [Branchiostoma floridae]|uniref:E3 ubiquitin-protein ligase TRIM37-like n=2 Tax=Branchiostoma floridae TaxID=7739 RepID=A0A9J7KGM8_BRAFL|nr:E3 ubiquitin-protein ligase TRIM37-like [Branchiostoma floridae]